MSEKMAKLFADAEGEFLKFERIPLSERRNERRRDLCALIYLDELLGGTHKVISGSTWERVYLAWGEGDLLRLSAADVTYLTRCGVLYDEEQDCLFVYS